MKPLRFLLLLALPLAGILILARRTETPEAPQPETTSSTEVAPAAGSAQEASPPAAGALPVYAWHLGDHASWKLAASVKMACDAEQLEAAPGLHLSGTLRAVVASTNADQVALLLGLSGVAYATAGQRVPAVEKMFEQSPALLVMARDGTILDLLFPDFTGEDDRRLLRIAYAQEVVVRPASNYETDEFNPDCAPLVRAVYQRGAPLADIRVIKRHVLHPEAVSQTTGYQHIAASEFTADLGHLWFKTLTGREDTTVFLDGEVFTATSTAIALREVPDAPRAPRLMAILQNPDGLKHFTPVADRGARSVMAELRRAELAARYAPMPVEEILAPLGTALTMQEATMSLAELKNWLAVHQEDGPGQLLAALRQQTEPAHDIASGMVVHALAGIEHGTPLTDILTNSRAYAPAIANQAAVAAGGLGAVADPGLKDALFQAMRSDAQSDAFKLSDVALLAVARLAETDPSCRQVTLDAVQPWLEAAASPEQTAMALHACANARLDDPAVVSRARQLSKSEDPTISRAAEEFLEQLAASDGQPKPRQ